VVNVHEPVLVNEVMDLLSVREGGRYIDGTVGSGGHAEAILKKAGRSGFLLGIDRDIEAVKRASKRLKPWSEHSVVVHGNYSQMDRIVRERGIGEVDGILLDLGVSSEQLDDPSRGFSFMADGPLDMRMDTLSGQTAGGLLNDISEENLVRLIRVYGEERGAKRIARAIVRERERGKIKSTLDLAKTVERLIPRRGRRHPATKVFQAVRMAVNDELENLEKGLLEAVGLLKEGGRIAVIAFHSLEDRIVKRFMAEHAGRNESLQEGGVRWLGTLPRMRLLNKKPMVPSDEEAARNPRARSAKLRAAEVIKVR